MVSRVWAMVVITSMVDNKDQVREFGICQHLVVFFFAGAKSCLICQCYVWCNCTKKTQVTSFLMLMA